MIRKEAGLLMLLAIATGLGGDIILQLLINFNIGGKTGWGLRPYFIQHGRAESVFIAMGIMAFFYALYAATGLPFKIQYLFVYGIVIDLFFRYTKIFSSLDSYYTQVGIIPTAVIGASLPLIIPLLLWKVINPSAQIF